MAAAYAGETQYPSAAAHPQRPTLLGRLPVVGARAVWLPILLALVTAASRVPFAGTYLVNWDAVQYALGLTDFDVIRHQPHPPGSILYVALGRLFLTAAADANLALVWISVVASAASTALVFAVGRRMFGERIAAVATALFAVSPLTWFYGAVALPYALEGALALAAVGLCWEAADERRPRLVLAAAVVLTLAGGVRQTTLVLLLPLWLYAAWRAGRPNSPFLSEYPEGEGTRRLAEGLWREVWLPVAGLLLMGALCLAWAIPLLVLSGGPASYLRASRQLSSLVSGLSSVFAGGPGAVAMNLSYVLDVTGVALNAALACFAVYLVPGVRWPWRPSAPQRWFLLLWAAPPLLVFASMHIGQAGYLLLLLPLGCYAAATAALSAADTAGRVFPAHRRRLPAILATALAITSAVLFLAPPLFAGPPNGLSAAHIRLEDQYWRSVVDTVRGYSPVDTVLLTGTGAAESFRQAGYYLSDYEVLAIGPDRSGNLGVAFEAMDGRHTYARFMAGGAAAAYRSLPLGTRRLIALDPSVAGRFPGYELEELPLGGDRSIWVWEASDTGRAPRSISFPPGLEVK